ncbi:hypothetical protein, partial [Pseudomonas aeruginosa]|uniref:hypothetical protein n=1 Tax=Pseudomonas aeruginosa TaxID=287 RepID=UPI001C8960B0
GLWIPGLGVLLPENQGRLPRESAMNLFSALGKAQAGDGVPAGNAAVVARFTVESPVRRAFMTSDGVPRPRRKPTVQSENFRFFFEPLNERGSH